MSSQPGVRVGDGRASKTIRSARQRVRRSLLDVQRGKRLGAFAAASLVATGFVLAAVRSEGTSATNVQLDDGAVWVTNDERNLVGRLNLRINELDAAVVGAENGIDVLQEDRTVLFAGSQGGVQSLDVLTNQMTGRNSIPLANYRIGGGVGALLEPASGRLWVGPSSSPVAPEYPEEPDAIVATNSQLVVTASVPQTEIAGVNDADVLPDRGRVLVLDGSGWREVALDESLAPYREGADRPTETTMPRSTGPGVEEPIEPLFEMPTSPTGVTLDDVAETAAVGSQPVILTNSNEVVFDDERRIALPGVEARLQQTSSDTVDGVIVATDTGLYRVSFDDEPHLDTLVEAVGTPSNPVQVGSCAYAAWTGEEPTYARWCLEGTSRGPEVIPGAEPDAELVWRVNQLNIALNSVGNGDVWAEHEGSLAYVGNWSDVEPRQQDQEVEESQGESKVVTERRCIDGGDEVPVASDDQVGARPRQSVIDVLSNDDDYNCEPIRISSVDPEAGAWGSLTIIDDGQHLLYSPSDEVLSASKEQQQQFSFSYTAADAQGNTSTSAQVSVSVRDRDLGNTPPQLRPKGAGTSREMRTMVEAGRSVSYQVMADWWDPDGDDLRLVSAVAESAGEVSFTPDGLVRFGANGVSPGILPVAVTVSDGSASTTETLEVTVKPIGSQLPPTTSDDFLTTVVDETNVISPLENDSDPNEDALALTPMWATGDDEADERFRTKLVGDSVEFVGSSPGVYRLEYEATDGTESTPGSIMVEVRSPGESNRAPAAVPDQVKLRPDRVVNVDVLANDVDLDGDILSVVDVDTVQEGSNGSVRASIVDRRMLQVEVVPGASGGEPVGPFELTYTVADGFEEVRATDRDADDTIADSLRARGTLTILMQPGAEDQPPLLTEDEAIVRVADFVEIPVLRNDTDPDGDELTLAGLDQEAVVALEDAGEAVAWVEGRNVVVYGGKPGRYDLVYTVAAGGHQASSTVSVVVTEPPDPETNPNRAPEPDDLQMRAIRGGTVRLKIPTTGVDPDGDSVVVVDQLGIPDGAENGNRLELDPDEPSTVWFTAGANAAPTSSFEYTVRDLHGAESTGAVQVMIVDDAGWGPQAHDDVWKGKPGRTLSIPVLANDSSPQDRRLELEAEPFFGPDGQPAVDPANPGAVRLLDQKEVATRGRVEVDVPVEAETLSEHYRISDGFSDSSAFIRVTSDPNTPNMAPVAEDDEVRLEELEGVDVGDPVIVDVLANDYDPDDAGSALTYSLPEGQAATFIEGKLEIPVAEQPRIVLYRVTDSDGDSVVGVVRVPGVENHPPELSEVGKDPGARVAAAGDPQPIEILLDDITIDPDGDPQVRLTETEVSVGGGIGEVRRLDDDTGFVYTPPDNITESQVVSIAFEATDRPEKSPDARQEPGCNCLASLVVPVTVEASSPPRVVSPGFVEVPQFNEPVGYDVAPLTIDDQGDELTYEFDSSSFGGLDVQQSGSQLTITSTGTGGGALAVGQTITLRYTVSDGDYDPVGNTVTVRIVATNRGQPAAGALGPFEAERGTSLDLPNLLEAAVNPFAGDGEPLTLVNYQVTTGGTLTCSDSGDCEFITESDDVFEFTATYTIEDALGQTATGSFEISSKGAPLAPGVPSGEPGDAIANLTWTSADMQGGTLVRYHVKTVETGEVQTFDSTGGTVSDLTNATSYTFQVAAENELGIGEWSEPSSPITPDRLPDPPRNLRFVDYGDRTLTLAWDPPATVADYSAIKQYRVSIGGQSFDVDAGTTELTVGASGEGSALQNGTDYAFKVRSQNSASTQNGWGAWSANSADTERPSRQPDAPTGVSGANSGDGGQPRITVTWKAPKFDGGRPITKYRVCAVGGPCRTVDGATRQATFQRDRGTSVKFVVVAFNSDKNRNNSDESKASDAVTAVGNPDPPAGLALQSGDHALLVNYTARNNSGCSSYVTEFSINGGKSWQQGALFSGLTNGTTYSVIARTRLDTSCGTPGVVYVSDTTQAVSGTPYGPLRTPSISASGGGTNTITWTWHTNRGDDGRPGWKAQLSGDCDNTTVRGDTGVVERNWEDGAGAKTCTITVSADGVQAKSDSATATVVDYQPELRLRKGRPLESRTCTFEIDCAEFEVQVTGFPAFTDVYFRLDDLPDSWMKVGTTNEYGETPWLRTNYVRGMSPPFAPLTKCWVRVGDYTISNSIGW